ncbi:hypothetical protein C8R43DRAFT_1052955 [Mycena crocata]|nr:hypothetical protein C8R43DRAFT_1052955 [Mycena crocata]
MGMGPPPVPKKNAPPPGSTFTGYVPASTSTSSPFTSNATASTSAQAKAAPTPTDPKVAARTMTPTALPAFVFSVLTNAPNLAPEHVKAREAARKLEKSALPVFDFTAPAPASGLDKGKGKEVDKPAVQGFNWAAAGGAPPKAKTAATGSWECGTCMLSNGPEATEKCAVCDAPREKPTPKVAQGFNWAAAGVKPPKPKNAEGSWTCGTCMLTNGPEVKESCAVCDSPRG